MCGHWERNDDGFRSARPNLRTTRLGCSDNPHTPLTPAKAGVQGHTMALTLFSGSPLPRGCADIGNATMMGFAPLDPTYERQVLDAPITRTRRSPPQKRGSRATRWPSCFSLDPRFRGDVRTLGTQR